MLGVIVNYMPDMKTHNGFLARSSLFVLIAFFLAAILYSRESVADPVVAWAPRSITYTIAPGQQQTISTSFTASQDLSNVSIRVVPALQSMIQVSPVAIAAVQRDQTVAITLTVATDQFASLAVTEGTIQVIAGNKIISQPLPIQIIVASNPIGLLPPDPGNDGKATLAGIDSDNDGVRDDIERYIWLTYPHSQKTRLALTSDAIAMQAALLSRGDPALASGASDALGRAAYCLWYIYDGPASFPVSNNVEALYLNTSERSRAYKAYFGLLNGQFVPGVPESQRKAQCAFDPDTLPN